MDKGLEVNSGHSLQAPEGPASQLNIRNELAEQVPADARQFQVDVPSVPIIAENVNETESASKRVLEPTPTTTRRSVEIDSAPPSSSKSRINVDSPLAVLSDSSSESVKPETQDSPSVQELANPEVTPLKERAFAFEKRGTSPLDRFAMLSPWLGTNESLKPTQDIPHAIVLTPNPVEPEKMIVLKAIPVTRSSVAKPSYAEFRDLQSFAASDSAGTNEDSARPESTAKGLENWR
ncbi:MAG TPA: hypothetical protein PKD64_15865 [Pirellulaceae bacterium]|nr:hypothetical protein [Pirellulaceae bacterium]HMO93664.1 hypothetical protein [Pirellulaceae bacterium]